MEREPMRPRDDEGASAVEYALILAAIAAVVVFAAVSLGGVVNGLFTESTQCVQEHVASACR
jgi:pilus assembly protein Flp/PilA